MPRMQEPYIQLALSTLTRGDDDNNDDDDNKDNKKKRVMPAALLHHPNPSRDSIPSLARSGARSAVGTTTFFPREANITKDIGAMQQSRDQGC